MEIPNPLQGRKEVREGELAKIMIFKSIYRSFPENFESYPPLCFRSIESGMDSAAGVSVPPEEGLALCL